MIFFTFLVANVGGGLTPTGPPLFLGLLAGVPFLWTLQHMAAPVALTTALLLAVFFAIDLRRWRRNGPTTPHIRKPLRLKGARNLAYLSVAVAAVLASGLWRPGVELNVLGVGVALQDLMRDATLLALAALSWTTTPRAWRIENAFTWAPLAEVVWLFAGIFATMIPVLAILSAGAEGALAPLVALATDAQGQPRDAAYFWTTGLLSGVLDNAPTFLIFTHVAGGDAAQLTGQLARTLTAISAGAALMGGLTYIGNAPNFMIRAIAIERGVRMPSFFGFIGWSAAVLLPVFAVLTLVFFR